MIPLMKFIVVSPGLTINVAHLVSIENINPGGEIITLIGNKTFQVPNGTINKIL
jgi:hypothetical protein